MTKPAQIATRSLDSTTPLAAAIDLGPLSGHLAFAVHRAGLALRRDFMAHMDDEQIRPMVFHTLALLGANPGIAQSQLASALAVDKGTMTHLVRDLERRGWVESGSRFDDRRCKDVFLSPLGVQMLERIKAAVQLHTQGVEALLTPDERQLLLQLLHRLERNLGRQP
ncbi:MAG TPA: MarR family transcriptional regulator [Povalibacter sp.]|nr:MarR family transcriptional regulator [Povalibacter sp.]